MTYKKSIKVSLIQSQTHLNIYPVPLTERSPRCYKLTIIVKTLAIKLSIERFLFYLS